ncbi:RNA polymerase I-specific transcription initiation factor rrn3-like isoform X1 [Hibiscus syriacus]|uniref:RNA polymerase I-specific transcription initiation factor rrn3-like isoform X1 n=1 Tax=Hibiscus syriacus TaxID=106335 RepID=A0A6A2WUG6_HIBSY|nr:RNA polymerase I-specific transcription initiation factor rrn3-like isoform X1 [Hibiscus syriacus]
MDAETGLFWKAKIEKMYEELGQMEVVFFSPEDEAKFEQGFKDLKLARRDARRHMFGWSGKQEEIDDGRTSQDSHNETANAGDDSSDGDVQKHFVAMLYICATFGISVIYYRHAHVVNFTVKEVRKRVHSQPAPPCRKGCITTTSGCEKLDFTQSASFVERSGLLLSAKKAVKQMNSLLGLSLNQIACLLKRAAIMITLWKAVPRKALLQMAAWVKPTIQGLLTTLHQVVIGNSSRVSSSVSNTRKSSEKLSSQLETDSSETSSVQDELELSDHSSTSKDSKRAAS